MIDFKELNKNGDDFELLVRELLHRKGLEVYWSGKGPDGGKDLLCIEKYKGNFRTIEKRWLVQCKHNAHSGNSVSKNDLDSVSDSCDEHNATGYLLVCTTFPSSSVVSRLEGIQRNKNITTCFWDCNVLERELMQPINWSLITTFMPNSAKALGWQISSIDNKLWYAMYKGFNFYISLRIGTNCMNYLNYIEKIIVNMELEQEQLPKNHYIRLRAIYYDDKRCNFHMFVDYLFPDSYDGKNEQVNANVHKLSQDIWVDGIYCYIDFNIYKCRQFSDNFDVNHQNYYDKYIANFKSGCERIKEERGYITFGKDNVREITEELVNDAYNKFIEALEKVEFLRILRSNNAKVEHLDGFGENISWEFGLLDVGYNLHNFFNVEVVF